MEYSFNGRWFWLAGHILHRINIFSKNMYPLICCFTKSSFFRGLIDVVCFTDSKTLIDILT
ncbi:unnamed protein product [Brassica rapa]|uniref:Uncharacterized protein n=1 Tax=Brassica campestris TaxID=3711 RepID=A0A3P5Y1H9_BRACM|nr:unnamed protein product [Brassica rapa]VDC61242.1 unnamed protein product [Brassica rapa]